MVPVILVIAGVASVPDSSLPLALLPLGIHFPLFLPLPMTTLFVVFADPEGFPELVALFYLRLGQLMDLMALQASRIRT